MKKAKFFLIIVIVVLLAITQFVMVSAAPSPDKAAFLSGTVKQVTLSTDLATGYTTVEITMVDDQGKTRTVVVDGPTAKDLGLVWYDESGSPHLVETLPASLEIPTDSILTDEAHQPVANALAAYFSQIPGVDYDAIMAAHDSGYGFGTIAQALWLTQKMGGDAEVMTAILDAKKSGDYSAFTLPDGTVPTNWGQFKKAVMAGDKKNNLGAVMSNKDNGNSGNNGNPGNGSNGNGNSNGNANGNGSNNGNHGNGNNGNNGNNGSNGDNGNNGNGKNKP